MADAYNMTMARPANYWVSSTAIYITLNAMGSPDYLQGNVTNGAQILCYMKDIDGLGYDAGHNYQRWPLALSPTYFNTTTEKYLYVAIPRKTTAANQYAQVVFPSVKLDIYGKNESGEQIGSTDYYFIWLQGIISASVINGVTVDRAWTQRAIYGTLSSDEALAAGGADSWWRYSSVDDTVEFLKTITKAVFENLQAKIATITQLVLGGDKLFGVAKYPPDDAEDTSTYTSDDSDDTVVTPKYLGDRGEKDWISKKHDDHTDGHITFNNGAEVKNGLKSDNIQNSGNITNEGDIKTKNLYVTGTAHFFELDIDKIRASGGARIDSAADGFTVDIVEPITDSTRIRLYWLAENDGKSIMNMWKIGDQAICQSFNKATIGTSHNISNKFYWVAVTDVSGSETVEKEVNGITHLYNWIEIDSSIKEESCTVDPEVGDEIAQLGYRGTDDVARQSAFYSSTYVSIDTDLTPPCKAVYRGINDFNLKTHRYSYIDAYNVILKGVTIQQLEDTNKRMEIDSSLGYMLDFGETTTLTCKVYDALLNDHTAEVAKWNIQRSTGDETNDAAWLQKDKVKAFNKLSGVSEATIDIAFTEDDIDIAETTLLTTVFTITAYDTDNNQVAQQSLTF